MVRARQFFHTGYIFIAGRIVAAAVRIHGVQARCVIRILRASACVNDSLDKPRVKLQSISKFMGA